MISVIDTLMSMVFKLVQIAICIGLCITAITVPLGVACAIKPLAIAISAISTISIFVILFAAYGFVGVIKALKGQVAMLAQQNNTYKALNSDYSNKLETHRELLESQKKENNKLKEVQSKMQHLLSALMEKGDDFNEFGKVLKETTEKNINLAEKLEILTNDLIHEKFDLIDEDRNGVLTKSEIIRFNK